MGRKKRIDKVEDQDLEILRVLFLKPETTSKELVDRFSISMSTVGSRLRKYQRMGLLSQSWKIIKPAQLFSHRFLVHIEFSPSFFEEKVRGKQVDHQVHINQLVQKVRAGTEEDEYHLKVVIGDVYITLSKGGITLELLSQDQHLAYVYVVNVIRQHPFVAMTNIEEAIFWNPPNKPEFAESQ